MLNKKNHENHEKRFLIKQNPDFYIVTNNWKMFEFVRFSFP